MVCRAGIPQDEMLKLAAGLTSRGIKFWAQSFSDGLQIVCEDNGWDAICNNVSIGSDFGLIEVMGLPQCENGAIGRLTADEVLCMVDNPTKAYWECAIM